LFPDAVTIIPQWKKAFSSRDNAVMILGTYVGLQNVYFEYMQCDEISLSLLYIRVTIHTIKMVRMLLMLDRMNKLWSPYVYILYILIGARVVVVVVVVVYLNFFLLKWRIW